MELTKTTFVTVENGTVSVTASGPNEAKIALKELKLKKKEFGVLKKEIASNQREIRANHSHEVSTRGSKFQGGGGLGRFIRIIQTLSRDSKRASTANKVEPLEQRKREIDSIINSIESAIIQVEAYLLKNKC
jgi:hypothetical protein